MTGPDSSHDETTGPLHAYLSGTGLDGRGRSAQDVLRFSNRQLEDIHDYIQWLFPLPARSAAQPSAPILTASEIVSISSDTRAQSTLLQAMDRMTRFYRETDDWLTGYDHNHLRITRIIQSLRMLVSPKAARGFHETILARHQAAGAPVNNRSLQYWQQAVEY
ncbi:opioid growth factor receptor-related protein [Microvirga sp. 2YAF29]|uniref:opioid growth factor receptor-related protein n=1 Tax=Microvirga sp. 2YAF29 TaxID=3233031 RepID=UPI003F953720